MDNEMKTRPFLVEKKFKSDYFYIIPNVGAYQPGLGWPTISV